MGRGEVKDMEEFPGVLDGTCKVCVYQRFLLDCGLAEHEALRDVLGIPAFEDQFGEVSDSEERVFDLGYGAAVAASLSQMLCASVVEYLRTSDDFMREAPDELLVFLYELLHRVSMATAIGSITQLRDIGFLDYNYEHGSEQ